jgi:hypothetical protein
VLAVAVLGGVLVTGACASAAAKPQAAGASSTSAPAIAPAAGTANIMIYSVNTDAALFQAIVSGVIGDYGSAVGTHPDGNVGPSNNSVMELQLSQGSFALSATGLNEAFVKVTSHEPIYPPTCTDMISVTATTPIVTGSGAGAYRGIRGSFSVTLTLNEVEARPCQPSPGAFRAQLITITGSGTVSF